MLEIRPSCEHCARDLPPDSGEAMICSYECTFCRSCVTTVLQDVCPNCGGGFVPRPVRPRRQWRDGVSLANHPARRTPVHKPVEASTQRELVGRVAGLPAAER